MKVHQLIKIQKRIETKQKKLSNLNKRIKNKLTKLGRERAKLLKPEYTRKVHLKYSKEKSFFNKIPIGSEYIVITNQLTNRKIYEEHLKLYGSGTVIPDDHTTSVGYYRKYGILFRTGGGHLILEDEQPCNDRQWEELKKGNLTEFLR